MSEPGAASYGELASIGQRGLSKVIDWVLYLAASFVIIYPFIGTDADGTPSEPRLAYLGWMGFIAFSETVPVAMWGKTVGKWVTGIKVVSVDSGEAPTILWAFLRVAPVLGVLAVVPSPFFLAVVAIMALSAQPHAQRRSILDRLAHTAVVVG